MTFLFCFVVIRLFASLFILAVPDTYSDHRKFACDRSVVGGATSVGREEYLHEFKSSNPDIGIKALSLSGHMEMSTT